jgi:hypothetical protein
MLSVTVDITVLVYREEKMRGERGIFKLSILRKTKAILSVVINLMLLFSDKKAKD